MNFSYKTRKSLSPPRIYYVQVRSRALLPLVIGCVLLSSSARANLSRVVFLRLKLVCLLFQPRVSAASSLYSAMSSVHSRFTEFVESVGPQHGQVWQTPKWQSKVVKAHSAGKGPAKGKVPQSLLPVPGLPPPPASAIGNKYLTGIHNYKWSQHVSPQDFLPYRNTLYVSGRPVQCLVITHHHAPRRDWMPYLNFHMRPLNPICLLGVSAGTTESPSMKTPHSVTQWWKVPFFSHEHILNPYM